MCIGKCKEGTTPDYTDRGSQSTAPAPISFDNLWMHYYRFLNGDGQCSKLLKEAFSRIKKDEEAISSWRVPGSSVANFENILSPDF